MELVSARASSVMVSDEPTSLVLLAPEIVKYTPSPHLRSNFFCIGGVVDGPAQPYEV